jgi:16S rRNA (uracil1498-N3)-methyltransferase
VGLNRYFVPHLPPSGSIELPPEEAHHALRVRREVVGAQCAAFDGLGHIAICRIARVTKRDVAIEVESHRFEPNEPPGHITLAVAMPKGDRQKAVIERAVELGVHELVPLICQRSISVPHELASEKWLRTVIEACKQCERNRLMSIVQPRAFDSLIDAPLLDGHDVQRPLLKLIAHPLSYSTTHPEKSELPREIADTKYDRVIIAIGPEGGFTSQEIQIAIDADWRQIDFGPRILRVETAVCMASFFAGQCVGNEFHFASPIDE